jgi:micrococcal nuclease
MARRSQALVALAAAATAAACGGGEDDRCGPTSGVVARVVDGDTIELESGERIRYLLVDTPENTTEVECFGPEAAELNRELVEGKQVTLRYDVECTDRYDRLLAWVEVDGREVNQLLVERGYGCVLYIPPNGEDRVAALSDAEELAHAEGRGLWAACEDNPCN